MKIIDFAKKHHACSDGVNHALSLGVETMEELWTRDWNAEDRIWVATRKGVLTDRELRLFACCCVRQVWHLLTDERSRNAVEVAERHANGQATDEELAAARAAARDAAWAAVCDAVCAAARAAARDAAWAAAWAAARDAARDAAWDAARAATMDAARAADWAACAAAWAAVSAAAWSAVRDAQSRWLIENTEPMWEGVIE